MDDSLKEIAEIRNLLHGVQATGDRIRRLKVLYRISEHSPNLQLINEVAAFWWMAHCWTRRTSSGQVSRRGRLSELGPMG